ncbi:hypothetical protein C3Y87_07705 [Carbonactinospora thermoautotrophica]|uniref:hypothetical protein n=1 Tax=Carbonactinospora thermoautotrophica TaxID=1469144 RepID=UPI00227134BA|nr:hypothetical protein [Carbonactinospora thermoautotrophica]MCX9191298.1 hypothetical protein [Carbonactinospora thermoautotrophica]
MAASNAPVTPWRVPSTAIIFFRRKGIQPAVPRPVLDPALPGSELVAVHGPYRFDGHTPALRHLTPKWSGSDEEMFDFALRAATGQRDAAQNSTDMKVPTSVKPTLRYAARAGAL